MRAVGLFAGIGGIELGLHRAGFQVEALSENDPHASAVLETRFKGIRNLGDLRTIRRLPSAEILTAGFPCQDLSQAGATAGIHGPKSGLIALALDLVEASNKRPDWLLLENVPFMLSLQRGVAMSWLARRLSDLGYRWAYRIIDARAFGISQRRRRLFILASRNADPAQALFSASYDCVAPTVSKDTPRGFYWTEGNRGIGWAIDAVPPIKCSSGLNIASPPAIWLPAKRSIVTPTIEDAEALQGFRRGWSKPAAHLAGGDRARWRLVGNAVTVPISKWIGEQILRPSDPGRFSFRKHCGSTPWPGAGFVLNGEFHSAQVSEWPVHRKQRGISEFISASAPSLSARASAGFYRRLTKSRLRTPPNFIDDLSLHIARMTAYGEHRPTY